MAVRLDDLQAPPSNPLGKLKGGRSGRYSIRINDRYRIFFRWEDGRGTCEVPIVEYR